MLKFFFWLRYLKKKRIALLSIASVALAVALLVVVSSLFGGFIDGVKKTGSEVFGDIYLDPWTSIPQYPKLIERLEAINGVASATAIMETYGLVRLDSGNIKTVHIIGIDPVKYSRVTGLKQSLLIGKDLPDGPAFSESDTQNLSEGFVGIGVLASPDEVTDEYDFESIKEQWVGKELLITTGVVVEKDTAENNKTQKLKQKHIKFQVADVVFTGMFPRDNANIFLPIETVRAIAGSAVASVNAPHETVLIKLSEGADTELVMTQVRGVWQQFASDQQLASVFVSNPQIATSEQMQKYFLIELYKQMDILMLIFGIVCSAAIMLIFCIFYMIVMAKQKDIAVIKSCGATKTAVVSIFLGFGACIGVVGSVCGVAIGYFFIRNINIIEDVIRTIFGIKLWKSSVYMFTKIPNHLDFPAACWIMFYAVIAAIIGAIIPAIVAARSNPVRILRYE